MFKKFIITFVLLASFVVPAFSQSILHEIPSQSNGWVDSLMISTPLMNKSTPYTRQSPSTFSISSSLNDTTLAYRLWPTTLLAFKAYRVDSLTIITYGGVVGGTAANNYVVPICTTNIRRASATKLRDTISYMIPVDGTTRTLTGDTAAYGKNQSKRSVQSISTATMALPVYDVFWVFTSTQSSDSVFIKEGRVIRKRY